MATGTTGEDVQARIEALRAVQRAYQNDLRDAEELEVAAMAAEQKAREAQQVAHRTADEARAAVHVCSHELDVLLTEWQRIPKQREG